MEYVLAAPCLVAMQSLAHLVAPHREATARKLFAAWCARLAYLHANGVVHKTSSPTTSYWRATGARSSPTLVWHACSVALKRAAPRGVRAAGRDQPPQEGPERLSSDGTRDGSEGIGVVNRRCQSRHHPRSVRPAHRPTGMPSVALRRVNPPCSKSAPGTPALTLSSTLRGPAPPALAPAFGWHQR